MKKRYFFHFSQCLKTLAKVREIGQAAMGRWAVRRGLLGRGDKDAVAACKFLPVLASLFEDGVHELVWGWGGGQGPRSNAGTWWFI